MKMQSLMRNDRLSEAKSRDVEILSSCAVVTGLLVVCLYFFSSGFETDPSLLASYGVVFP
jgi:Kef-type K+ transport system membrane component KefB